MKDAILPMISGIAMIILAARKGKRDRRYFERLEEV